LWVEGWKERFVAGRINGAMADRRERRRLGVVRTGRSCALAGIEGPGKYFRQVEVAAAQMELR
jgi:hypothetical protein